MSVFLGIPHTIEFSIHCHTYVYYLISAPYRRNKEDFNLHAQLIFTGGTLGLRTSQVQNKGFYHRYSHSTIRVLGRIYDFVSDCHSVYNHTTSHQHRNYDFITRVVAPCRTPNFTRTIYHTRSHQSPCGTFFRCALFRRRPQRMRVLY